jgi:hypothetical protein
VTDPRRVASHSPSHLHYTYIPTAMARPNCETTQSAAGLLKTPRRTLFMPSPSSPLSPRRPNPSSSPISATVRCGTMLPSPPRSPPDFLVPKRLFKPIPLGHTGEEGRNARRRLFLKKVRDSRETKMMNARGGPDEVGACLDSLKQCPILTLTR